MTDKIDEMLRAYSLHEEGNLATLLDASWNDDETRKYCREVLLAFPGLKKETWLVGIEGGDYIYSFGGHFIFITDDIWSFNVIARQPVLSLLAENMIALRARHQKNAP